MVSPADPANPANPAAGALAVVAIADAAHTRLRDAAPFALLLAVCLVSPAVPHSPGPNGTWWLGAALVLVLAGLAGGYGLARRRPAVVTAAAFLVFPAVQLLRAADGNSYSGFSPMLMLPILWFALHGTRGQLAGAVGAAAAILALPIVSIGAPQYPASTIRGAALLLVVMTSLGAIVAQLVTATRSSMRRSDADAARFGAVVERAPLGIALLATPVTAASRFTTVNRSLCALLGHTEEQLLALPLTSVLQSEDVAGVLEHVARGLPEPVEIRMRHRAGHAVWVSLTSADLGTPSSDRTGQCAWHIQDARPERAADATVIDLLDTERRASEALRAVDRQHRDLLASISHDLRTPITAALGYSELLADGEFGSLTAPQQRTAEVITRSLENLSRIINELVVIGPELTRADLPADRLEVSTLVADAVHMVAIQAALRNQTVECTDTDAGALRDLAVMGDEVRLNRVLVNLLVNAVKFSPVGGRITVRVGARDGHAEISVTDTGCGISPDDQQRIFERFYRAPRETEDPTVRGSGLGLAIVKAIVTQHGGTIGVTSTPGQGATFTLRLPVADASLGGGDAGLHELPSRPRIATAS